MPFTEVVSVQFIMTAAFMLLLYKHCDWHSL